MSTASQSATAFKRLPPASVKARGEASEPSGFCNREKLDRARVGYQQVGATVVVYIGPLQAAFVGLAQGQHLNWLFEIARDVSAGARLNWGLRDRIRVTETR